MFPSIERLSEKQSVLYILIIISAAALSFLMFQNGFPIGYDYKHQIVAMDAVLTQMHNGEAYPRWLSDVNNGFGGLNLFFYPPLIYYTGFLIDTITMQNLSITQILCGVGFTFLSLSGISFYIFAQTITSKKKALIASIIYISLPYHLWFEIYERNALSELSAYIWPPLIFYFLNNIFLRRSNAILGLSLSYAFLIISHLPTAVFTGLFAGFYAIIRMVELKSLSYTISLSFAFILSIGLSALYLYPALSLLDHTNSNYLWSGYYDYKNWFIFPPSQSISPDISLRLFVIALLQCLIVPLSCIIMAKDNKQDILRYGALSLTCFFLMTQASQGLWSAFPPLQKIQFPWRLLLISDFLYTVLLCYALHNIRTIRSLTFPVKSTLIICAGLHIATHIYIAQYVQRSPHPPTHEFEKAINNKFLTQEFIPDNPQFTASINDLLNTEHKILNIVKGTADITLNRKEPRHIALNVHAQTDTTIEIGQFHFHGWEVLKNKENITENVNIRNAKPFGQIRIDIPKGQYSLSLTIPPLPQEIIGLIISVCSILIWLLGYLLLLKRKQQ
ncbi:MAG: 6-pyruvoyl-tetrahydropterin synthase-related protein [Alphaproteobacteria bacterium]